MFCLLLLVYDRRSTTCYNSNGLCGRLMTVVEVPELQLFSAQGRAGCAQPWPVLLQRLKPACDCPYALAIACMVRDRISAVATL
jgi:hypothetical protein